MRPASISAPSQSDPDAYYFTPGGANIQVNPFIVDPPVCAVTYECISVTGPDADVQCTDSDVVKFSSSTGAWTFNTNNIAKYGAGEYKITIRGTAGFGIPVATEVVFRLVTVNPCNTATISNLQKQPFKDMEYSLSTEAVS